jgi:hypothetical protein
LNSLLNPTDPGLPPLVSVTRLRELEDELSDVAPCKAFIGSYVCMWGNRFARLSSAAHASDLPGFMDAVLSIRSSSQMAGALRLAGLAARAQRAAEAGDAVGIRCLVREIEDCGRETMAGFTETYLDVPA